MSDQPLRGAAALVTGASGGIGAATAARLVREGAAVALIARNRERLARLVDELTAQGGHAVAVPADLTVPVEAYRAVEEACDRLGRLDIVVNSASTMVLETALHTPIEEWDRMISLNVSGLLHVTHAAVPYLIDAAATSPRRVADLVNVGSAAGRVARPAGSVYHLTKFGLNGFTESLRQELLSEGVRVSVVAPGLVDTAARHRSREAAGRPERLRPEDISDSIAYIVTRDRRIAVNEIVVRPGGQLW
ncbi:SDR family oxidoreductase [Nocardia yamanashiensis]|uniref:SDR family oxidoreductase n=1 Tax=Nocardia yamanashiensis TaxID=209247 RepID=UPI0008304CB6|nr:SDR family NAD(P)-dependent oxidoreductase [Nocardia yamanashiensis]